MYAIVEQGGKQYKVSQGDVIEIDLVDVAEDAQSIEISKVLFVNNGSEIKVGKPYLDGAKVVAKLNIVGDDAIVKGPKLYPAQFRRRKNSRRRIGHRQKYTQVIIEKIEA